MSLQMASEIMLRLVTRNVNAIEVDLQELTVSVAVCFSIYMMLGTDKQPYVYGYELDQAWAKCLTRGPKWVLKLDGGRQVRCR